MCLTFAHKLLLESVGLLVLILMFDVHYLELWLQVTIISILMLKNAIHSGNKLFVAL